MTELRVTLGPQSSVTDAEGFSHLAGQTWKWDGETPEPRLRYGMAANRTTDRDGPMGAGGSYLYADVGDWALVQQPDLGYQWRYRGADSISVDRTTRVDGAGAVGETTAFLGPHATHTREVAGQEIRLIVPEAASLAGPPEEILDGLGNASRALHVGDRDPTVFAVAAPTGRVNWAAQGVQVGDTDFWVRATQPIDGVGNAWLHEYVHTRQSFRTADSARWLTEASATWYAALLSHREEGVSFDRLAEFLDRGTDQPQAGSVLADPGDWANNANYWKGALVTGEIDRRIRVATDRGATLQRVFASLNERTAPITNEDVLAAVADAGGESTRAAAERLTTTSDEAAVWNRSAHRAAFEGDTALLRVDFDPATDVRATGAYRNATVGTPVTVAAGETLSLRTAVENLGGAPGEYAVTLRVDDRAVATANGTLAPGEQTTVEYEVTATPDTHTGTYATTLTAQYETDGVSRVSDQTVALSPDPQQEFNVVNATSAVPVADTGTVTVQLRNDGPLAVDDAEVRLESTSGQFTFQGSASASRFVGPWAPNETRTVTYDVGATEDAESREYTLSAAVTYRDDDGDTATAPSRSLGVTPAPEQTFAVSNTSATLAVGKDGQLRGTVTNTGDRTVDSAVVRFLSQSETVTAIETEAPVGNLAPGESVNFQLPLEVSSSAEAGLKQFSLSVQYRNADDQQRESDTVDIRADVGPDADDFALDTNGTSVSAGDSTRLEVEVTNNGDDVYTDISAKLFAESPLSANDDEAFIARLEPGESETVVFSVGASSGALAKTYPLSMDFQYDAEDGDTLTSDTYRLPVDVTEDSDGGGLPVVPIAVALVLLVVGVYAYRRFA